MLHTLVVIIHVIVCIFLIIVVLVQSGKSADVAATFGGMGSQTAFGPRGAASALSKATTAAVIIFMITSMSLTIMATRIQGGSGSSGAFERAQPSQSQPAPQKQAPGQQQPAPAQQTPAPTTPKK
jgi:preprotein translocase subunit SecG